LKNKRWTPEARRLDVEAKIRAQDTRIMMADFATMDDDTRAWFLKKCAEIHDRDASSATPIRSTMVFLWTIFVDHGHGMPLLDYIFVPYHVHYLMDSFVTYYEPL
jgi:hypothetical protein